MIGHCELHALLASVGMEAATQAFVEEEMSVGVLRYMARQASFAQDLSDFGVSASDAAALKRALSGPAAASSAPAPASGAPGAERPSVRCEESASSAGGVLGAALRVVSTTEVVGGVGPRDSPITEASGWSATQINHVGAAFAPQPKPKSEALLTYLRREGKGHYADPGKVQGGGYSYNLDEGTVDSSAMRNRFR